jgi:hypothetical protein
MMKNTVVSGREMLRIYQDRQCHVLRNNEARSCIHCYSETAIIIAYLCVCL